jgi:DNA-directed RNA polymerase specialized sigma24 family protein
MNRERHSKDEAVILMTEFLSDLPSLDREALIRFYLDGQPHVEIEAALGLEAEHFRELRRSARQRFSEGRGGVLKSFPRLFTEDENSQ